MGRLIFSTFVEEDEQSTPGVSATIGVLNRNAINSIPQTVVIEATGWSGFNTAGPASGEIRDPRLHDLYYYHDFYYEAPSGSSYQFSAPDNIYDGNARHTGGHNNARYGYGYMCAHTYRTAGNYVIKTRIVEPSTGRVAVVYTSLTIGSFQFTGTDRILVSPSGDFSLAANYPGCVQVTSSDLASVWSTYVGGQEATPKQILTNPNETFTFGTIQPGFNGVQTPSLYWDCADPTGRSDVNLTGTIFWNDQATTGPGFNKDFVVSRQNFNGGMNGVSTSPGGNSFAGIFEKGPQMFSLDQCLFDSVPTTVEEGGTAAGYGLSVNDCEFSLYSAAVNAYSASAVSIMGVKLGPKSDTWVDAVTGNNGWGMRLGGNPTVVGHSQFNNKQDWFPTAGPLSGQSCLRLNADADEGTKINVIGNYFEGPFNVVSATHSSAPDRGRAINMLMEKNYFVADPRSVNVIGINFSGTTLRNNIFNIAPASGRINNPTAFISFDSRDNQPLNTSTAINIFNNTLVNQSGINIPLVSNTNSEFTNLNLENNIEHQVGISTADSPLGDDTNEYFVSVDTGYESSTENLRASSTTLKTAGAYDLFDPETTSNAIGDVSGSLVAYDDFFGVIRDNTLSSLTRSSYSRGAVEPQLEN